MSGGLKMCACGNPTYFTECALCSSDKGLFQPPPALAKDPRDARIAELEAAIDKLAQCRGRYHTEQNFKALVEVRNKKGT